MFYPAVPGHAHFTRQMEHMTGGRVDLMQRLIELCTVAKRHKVKVILSSWYYLHTFWFTDKSVTAELLGLPPEQRFIRFAQGLDRILEELKQRGLADTIVAAEIFNEVNGMDFSGGYGSQKKPVDVLHKFRSLHEEALDFLKTRHPDIRFALDTSTPSVNPDFMPRNAQVWTFHSYYLWDVYKVFEQNLLGRRRRPDRSRQLRSDPPFPATGSRAVPGDPRQPQGAPAHRARLVSPHLAVSQPRTERHAGVGASAAGKPGEAHRPSTNERPPTRSSKP